MSRASRFFTLSLTLCASLFATQLIAALPDQPALEPATGPHGAFSVADTSAIPQPDPQRATAYDNFSLDADYILSGIAWVGIYAEPLPPMPSPTDFIINIFADDSGTPDVDMGPIWTASLDGGIAGASGPDVTVVANGDVSPPIDGPGGGPGYDYSAAISGTLTAGDYWISIVADQRFLNTVEIDPEWQWHLGDGPADGFYAFDALLDPDGTPESGIFQPEKDLAFTLRGEIVPEPSTALLSIFGVLALGVFRRKR